MTATTYRPAVMRNTGVNDPVVSTMNPTASTPAMPDRQPKVLHSPNICPAWFGAMSDMLATKPAWPREVTPSAAVMAATAAKGWMLGLARNSSAAAGTSMETDCTSLRTDVVLRPEAMRLSARKPAAELPTAMTSQGTRDRKLLERKSKPRAFRGRQTGKQTQDEVRLNTLRCIPYVDAHAGSSAGPPETWRKV